MKRKLHFLTIALVSSFSLYATNPEECQLSVSLVPQHVSCNGAGDGGVTAIIFDENDPPMLSEVIWSTGAQDVNSIQNLLPGTYSITVTNTDECTVTESIEITEPGELGSIVLDIQHVACAGEASGAVTFTAFGGTPPYTYNTDQGVFTVNGGENLVVENVLAGSYSAQLEDANGCMISSSYTVNEPLPLIASFVDVEGVLCPDDSTGTATVVAEGGTAPYFYQWSNGDTTETATNLPVGLVSVVVRDANNCLWQDNEAIVILDTEAPNVVVNNTLEIFLDDQGQAVLTPEMVDAGSSDNCAIESMNLDVTNFDCSDLGMQMVTLTVTDVIGNSAIAMTEVMVLDTIPPTLILPSDTVLFNCDGYFEYEVFAEDNCGAATPVFIDGLESGSFFPEGNIVIVTYEVEDIPSGNSTSGSFEVSVLNTVEASIVDVQNSCPDEATGQATVEGMGGSGSYTYQWGDANQQTTPTAIGLSQGDYSVTVTDSLNCAMEVFVMVEEFPGIEISDFQVVNENSGAGDGAIDIIVNGVEPFVFEWFLDGGSISDQQNLAGLSAGIYTVQITDANGCMFTSDPFEVENISSVSDFTGQPFELFPNPAGEYLYIKGVDFDKHATQVDVYTADGQAVRLSSVLVASRQLRLNLNDLPVGLYLIRIIVDGQETWERFVHH